MIADTVYDNYTLYAGGEVLAAVLAYSLQLYCDFLGYSCMAAGIAEMFGIEISKNFDSPYLSQSISEFWRRWHTSLSNWLRDYIYIPLGGSRMGKFRKYRNIIVVFAVSGLWHGSSMRYICWGMLHAFYQIIGELSASKKSFIRKKMRLKDNVESYKLFRIVVTFMLTSFAWIFFRAPSMKDSLLIIKRMLYGFDLSLIFGKVRLSRLGWHFSIGKNLVVDAGQFFSTCGLELVDLVIILMGIIVLIAVDYLHYKNVRIRRWIDMQNGPFRWMIYFSVIFIVLVLGIYGNDYDAASFIYSGF